jgi:hypothetical protein
VFACFLSLTQVIAFDQFCANVQRDVHSVLAMHHVSTVGGPSGGCKGNSPLIAGLNISMSGASRAAKGAQEKGAQDKGVQEKGAESKPVVLTVGSVSPREAVITITADSTVGSVDITPAASV